jgi:vacuolar protein sorting-associated protein 35
MEEDQDKILEDAVRVVKNESFAMQKALDASDMREALKNASNMIGEMKSSSMSPRTYYQLYMQVFDQMSRLENYFLEEYRRGRKISDLYEKVQHASAILPRLYLLVAVGSVYIQTRELPAKAILKDLIEMVKGVQHPMRGLFLRYYLNKVCKDKLPDKGSEYDTDGEGINDAIDFLLTNLSEMNRLWVRMQHTGSIKDKAKREKERNDLRVTVGENIVRLSSLQGLNIQLYTVNVLPKILEVIVSSKDAISQQYLVDCIIQAFPDSYHLHTLEPFLESLPQLQPTVDIKSILVNLFTRLADYAEEGDLDAVDSIDIFGLIKKAVDQIITEQAGSGETKALLQLQVAFIRLSLKCYPHNTDHVNAILNASVTIVDKGSSAGTLDSESLKLIVKLLSHPLETMSLAILSMNHYPKLMGFLQFSSRKQVAFKIVEAVVTSKKTLNSLETTEQLLHFITPLVVECSDSEPSESYEFEDEQQNVSKLVHLVAAESPEDYLSILNAFFKVFAKGGEGRIKFTYPSLLFAYLKFLKMLDSAGMSMDLMEILKTIHDILTEIAKANADQAIKLGLQIVLCINSFTTNSSYGQAAAEFVRQATTLYTVELADTNSKNSTVNLLTGTLANVHCIDSHESDELLNVVLQFASRQLKKSDQCHSLTFCGYLFHNHHVQDSSKVSYCLDRAVKIAQICASNIRNIGLFVSLLNQLLHFYVVAPGSIDSSLINNLIEFVAGKLAEDVESDLRAVVSEARNYMKNTQKFVKSRHGEGKLTEITA